MRNLFFACVVMLAIALLCRAVPVRAAEGASTGEEAFVKNCAVCHPNGGNVIEPGDTLDKKTLDKRGIKKPADIVAKMRKPGPGMTKFDEKAIPDKEAKAIAEYILKTFK